MAVRIITDSTSDIPNSAQKELGIDIIPLSVIFSGREYADGIELTNEQFYDMLSNSISLPTTSQVNPEGFYSLFKSYIEAGDSVVGIFISDKLSGTYGSAVTAKEMVGSDDIHLLDSKSCSFGMSILVHQAIKLRDSGVGAKEIINELTQMRDKLKFYAMVDTLKYLKLGGRLSTTEALVGGMLHIKPMIAVIDGEVKSVGKVRGYKSAYGWLLEKLKQEGHDTRYPLGFGHTNSPEALAGFIAHINKTIPVKAPVIREIGAVIGAHAGPGCMGIAFIAK